MIYFSTGNASNDLDGSKRPGANLFTSSIVAIDAHNGKYRWHFQEVHHDIWDYDAPSPVVLFEHGGTKGIGEPGKTGWLYLLDRRTGKPLVAINERPVPQSSFQKTAATQPFPSNAPFVTHTVSQRQFAQIEKIAKASAKGKPIRVENGKQIFAPPADDHYVVVTPRGAGGNSLAGTAHGDNLWLFGLDGTLGPRRRPAAAPR